MMAYADKGKAANRRGRVSRCDGGGAEALGRHEDPRFQNRKAVETKRPPRMGVVSLPRGTPND